MPSEVLTRAGGGLLERCVSGPAPFVRSCHAATGRDLAMNGGNWLMNGGYTVGCRTTGSEQGQDVMKLTPK